MKIKIKALVSLFILSLSGCASITYLPADNSVTYAPTESLRVYWDEPQEPFTIIGRVSAESEDFGEEALFEKLKEKAMAVGAHALIMGSTSQQSSVVGVPAYGGGTIIAPVTSTRLEGTAIRFKE